MKIDRDGWINLEGISISIGIYSGEAVVAIVQRGATKLIPVLELAKAIPMYEESPEEAVKIFETAIRRGALS